MDTLEESLLLKYKDFDKGKIFYHYAYGSNVVTNFQFTLS